MAPNPLHQAAVDFLLEHQAEHLAPDRHRLLERCAEHIRTEHATTRVVAEVTTLQALGDIASRSTGAHVDMDKTTSYAVFVTDDAGRRVVFTAQDLLRIAADHGGIARLTALRAVTH